MTAKLSRELADALKTADNGELQVVDPDTNHVYFVVDGDVHREAMAALKRQRDRDAIAEGVADMEAGRGLPVAEADAHLREKLGFPPRQAS